jgi:hypothetical protein
MANLVSSTLTGNLTVTANVSAANYTGNGAGLSGIASFASGTKMVFYQASAPTGWTQDTAAALSNTVMSVVTGTGGGTGGSTSYFSSFLATTDKSAPAQPVSGSVSGTVGGHTLSTPEIAAHSHCFCAGACTGTPANPFSKPCTLIGGTGPDRLCCGQTLAQLQPDRSFPVCVFNCGGSGSHAHPFSGSLASATADVTIPAANVKYANVIVATKD